MRWTRLSLVLLLCTPALPAAAKPGGPELYCREYGDTPACDATLVTCSQCHTSTELPVQWNEYGAQILGALEGASFELALPGALAAIEALDADGDGVTNIEEIALGTAPGDAASVWTPDAPPEGPENPYYRLGEYDHEFALRRVSVLYCGRSPSWRESQELRALAGDDARRTALHAALDACLASDYWRTIGLRELADRRVRPVPAVGADTQVSFSGFRLVLADYEWDYRLWRYVLSGDRDMRELLTAQYHVEEDDQGNLAPVEGAIADPASLPGGGQPLVPERRAGMITTQWFLMSNTMFSPLPRTTAAAAYRAYLGADISKQEGIRPVAGEPLDVDAKGVAAPTCAACHSTLDPLAYVFASYQGIEFPGIGTYYPARPEEQIPGWDPEAQRSELFGEPVADLMEWAAVAVARPEFGRNLASMFFEHAVGREPGPGDTDEFAELWQSLPADGYSANRLLHRLIDTDAFGAP